MERALLHLLRARDENLSAAARREAFGLVVAEHQDAAFASAYAVVGDPHGAQDAALEAFVIAWRELSTLRDPTAFGGWLRTLVRSQALRQTARMRKCPVSLTAAMEVVDRTSPDDAHRWIVLNDALARLPDGEREAIVLYYIAGLSREETASFTGTSVSSAKKRLARALAKLRKETIAMANEDIRNILPSNDEKFRKQTLLLTGRFAELLSSGRPILLALDDCIGQAGEGVVGAAFRDMRVQVTDGKLMADTMLKYPALFDVKDANAVQFGEEAGLLDQILRRLAAGEKIDSVESLRQEYANHGDAL